MFIIMQNLVKHYSNCKYVARLDEEIIEFFCNLYNIEISEDFNRTIENLKRFLYQ